MLVHSDNQIYQKDNSSLAYFIVQLEPKILGLVFSDFSSLIKVMGEIVREVLPGPKESLFRPENYPALFVTTFKMV